MTNRLQEHGIKENIQTALWAFKINTTRTTYYSESFVFIRNTNLGDYHCPTLMLSSWGMYYFWSSSTPVEILLVSGPCFPVVPGGFGEVSAEFAWQYFYVIVNQVHFIEVLTFITFQIALAWLQTPGSENLSGKGEVPAICYEPPA